MYGLELERTSQNKIAKELELASSQPEGDSNDSDESGAVNEANNYDSYKRYPPPPESTEWDATENGKDYWEQGERKFLTTEHSQKQHHQKHQSTQLEINALYGDMTLRKALGRYQLIQRAQNYQIDTGFMHRLFKDRNGVSTKYNIRFGGQTLLDLAAVADLNWPIVIETDDISTDAKEVDVLVSSYQLGPLVTLRDVLGNATARQKMNKKI
jgi:hypothetical protein